MPCLFFDEEVRRGLESGLNTPPMSEADLWPRGRNAVLGDVGRPNHQRRCAPIAKEIELEDPYEKIGAEPLGSC